jgi:flavodoxin I
MGKIGLFYGSDTGCTEGVANTISELLGEENVDLYDVYDVDGSEFDQYDTLILGLSTWHDGQLQSAWDDFFNQFKDIDMSGKTVALFGLGDQYGYSTYFCDGVGIIGKVAEGNGAKVIGHWSTDGYEHDESKAEIEPGTFMGLCIDEDNQDELTEERVQRWVEQIKGEGILN